jgi:ATP-binding cassette subfamily B protein
LDKRKKEKKGGSILTEVSLEAEKVSLEPTEVQSEEVNTVINVAKRNTKKFLGCAVLSIIASVLGLIPYIAVYLVTAHLFEYGLANANIFFIVVVTTISLLGAILKSITLGFAYHISHVAAYDTLYELRIELAGKMGTLPLGWFDHHNTGETKRIVHENVEKMEEALAHAVPELAAALAVPIISIIVLFFIDWKMALVLLACPVIGSIFSGKFFKRSNSEYGKYNSLLERMNSTIIQYINGMKIIKVFTQSQSSFSDIKALVEEIGDSWMDMGRRYQKGWAGVTILFRIGPLFVVPLGLLFFVLNIVSVPILVLFLVMSLGYARAIYTFMMHGSMALYQIQGGMKRINDLFNQKSLLESNAPRVPNKFDIQFDNVSFSYELEENDETARDNAAPMVLEDINFTIPHGSVVALVGPSGAGKTTISRLIPRFWDVREGVIRIGGIDIREIESTTLLNTISFVFQDVFLFNDSIYENIKLGSPNVTHEDIMTAAKLAQCDEFAEELGGYDYQVGENGARLSGGQKQRISIARAILKDAPIIVLDEATAFVDPENEVLIQEAIAALLANNSKKQKTLIVVAHRLSTITEVDEIMLINKGRIEARGTHQELLTSSKLYQTLWESHTDAKKWQFDKQSNIETTKINRNPTYDVEYAPLKDEFASLKSAKSYWSQIKGLVGEDKKLFRRSILWSFIEGIFMATPGFVIYLAILSLANNSVTPITILGLALALIIIFFIQWLLNKKAYISFMQLDTNIQGRLRLYLGDYLRRLPLGFFTSRDVGYIDALFTTTIDFMATRIAVTLLISSSVAPVVIFGFSLFIDWRMALIMACSVPIAVIFLSRSMRRFNRAWAAQREAMKKMNARLVEYIQGIQVIRAFNLSGDRFEQFESTVDKFRKASIKTATDFTPAIIGFSSILEIGFALIILIGTLFTNAGWLIFEDFLIFLLLGTSFYAPIMAMGDLQAFQRIINNGVNNINEFLATNMLPEPKTSKSPKGFDIEFKDVTFRYLNEDVLKDVSFKIPERSMVALVGPSGSGKTTITNLISRFWDVDDGSVLVGGIDVREMSSDALLSQISMVFQDVYLFNDTIMNNIRFGNPAATDEQLMAAARLAQADEFIQKMPEGYETVVGESGSTLSGGEKQRISIARAILKDAPIILLDEATASIDPENERLIQKAFNALVKNKTIVIIAHRLSTVQTADIIFVLDNNTITEKGTHQELIKKKGLYHRFWQDRQLARSWKLTSISSK